MCVCVWPQNVQSVPKSQELILMIASQLGEKDLPCPWRMKSTKACSTSMHAHAHTCTRPTHARTHTLHFSSWANLLNGYFEDKSLLSQLVHCRLQNLFITSLNSCQEMLKKPTSDVVLGAPTNTEQTQTMPVPTFRGEEKTTKHQKACRYDKVVFKRGVTHMLPVAELLSVGKEPLERSIWANLWGTASSSSSWTEPLAPSSSSSSSSCFIR